MAAIYQWFPTDLIYLTTVPYPIEIVEGVEFGEFQVTGGFMYSTEESYMTTDIELFGGSLTRYRYEIPREESHVTTDIEIYGGELISYRIEYGMDGGDMTTDIEIYGGELNYILVTAKHPEEAVDFAFEITGGVLEPDV